MPVKCQGRYLQQLCYGTDPEDEDRAQYAVCYNTNTLIPEFTGHVLNPFEPQAGGRDEWAIDRTNRWHSFLTIPPLKADLLTGTTHSKTGHLTPNADYADENDRQRTMLPTNIAPQWQGFNDGNWCVMEQFLRRFANIERHELYIFTGTSGQATNRARTPLTLNGRVVVPKYFWKAVCDPVHSQSIFFYARNPTDVTTLNKRVSACFGQQTETSGVVMCDSINRGSAAIERDVPRANIPKFTLNRACAPDRLGDIFREF
ncbi:unnamed protein product, partial [Porites lobata]